MNTIVLFVILLFVLAAHGAMTCGQCNKDICGGGWCEPCYWCGISSQCYQIANGNNTHFGLDKCHAIRNTVIGIVVGIVALCLCCYLSLMGFLYKDRLINRWCPPHVVVHKHYEYIHN